MITAAAASHAFMSNDGRGPSSWYIGRAVLMNMTSSSWLWRHRLLPPAFSTAYRFSSYRDYQIFTSSAAKLHGHWNGQNYMSFSHSSSYFWALLPICIMRFFLLYICAFIGLDSKLSLRLFCRYHFLFRACFKALDCLSMQFYEALATPLI